MMGRHLGASIGLVALALVGSFGKRGSEPEHWSIENKPAAMKYLVAILFTCLVSQPVIGQNVVHDYMVMSYRPHQNVRELVIEISGQEREEIDLRTVSGKSLSSVPMDIQHVFAKVQEFESQGWVVQSVSFNDFKSGAETSEKWIWLLKRPKT